MKHMLIVAHPDDEILFSYISLTLCPADWYVVCLTNYDNPVRAEEFRTVQRHLGTSWNIYDFPDQWDDDFSSRRKEIRDILTWEIQKTNPDTVTTHNESGEYGHSQHKALHHIVKELVHENLWVFGEWMMPLSFNTLKAKIDTLELYKSQCDLNAFDWYDQVNPDNNLGKYVGSEGRIRIK
jgi:LmbE family N-acetylglucosaminyl deacetylase